MARAYRHLRTHGHTPDWARKAGERQWEFDAAYIESDARTNLDTLSIHEAATLLGASRRTVQTWTDEGLLPSVGAEPRAKGEPRRIPRADFDRLLPELRKRLLTPTAKGIRRRRALAAKTAPKPTSRHRAETAADALLDQQIANTRKTREQAATHRKQAEAKARRWAAQEHQAEKNSTRLRRTLQSRLRSIQSAIARSIRKRREAERKARELAAEETLALKQEARLLEEKAQAERKAQLDADKIRAAAQLETLLQQSRQTTRARAIAERIQNDLFDGKLDRSAALKLFYKAAESAAIPPEIRTQTGREVFGNPPPETLPGEDA